MTATGRVWFAAPNRFRWQIKAPAETIALRQPDQVLVIYPRLKRIEKFPLSGEQPGPWKDALALLEAGFPRDRQQLESRFRIISITSSNGLAEVTLEPRSPPARRMMPEIKITFSTREFVLRATELRFADGSNMRNDFANQQINQPIEPGLFNPPLEGDYKVVEPMNK